MGNLSTNAYNARPTDEVFEASVGCNSGVTENATEERFTAALDGALRKVWSWSCRRTVGGIVFKTTSE